MDKIEINLHDNVINILSKLNKIAGPIIQIDAPEGAILFENIINIQLIKEWAKREEKEISIITKDKNGLNLLNMLENTDEESDFSKLSQMETNFDNEDMDDEIEEVTKTKHKKRFKPPKLNISNKALIVIPLGLALISIILFVGYNSISKNHKAEIKLMIDAQPLTRSFQVRIQNEAPLDKDKMVAPGKTVSASIDEFLEIETTGEKIIGEYAQGVVTIFNKTDEEKRFRKGTILNYDDNGKELVYKTTEDVTIPEREEIVDEENPNAASTYINGAANVKVEASEFGKKYNLDKGRMLEIDGEKKTNFVAEVANTIDGGKEEKLSIVAPEDIAKLKQDISENAEEKVLKALEDVVSKDTEVIKGAFVVIVTKEEFSHKLEDVTNKISLSQTFTARALTYKKEDLDKLADLTVEDFVPENFSLSTKERNLNVEILGKTETTILNETTADLQVTLRTFVVPNIFEDKVAKDIAGKNKQEAEKYLGELINITGFSLDITPSLPIFRNVPKDTDKILVIINRKD